MMKVMLSEFFGDSSSSVCETDTSHLLNVHVSDVVEITQIPLKIQENEIKNEQDPEKRQDLQRQYDDLISVSKPLLL